MSRIAGSYDIDQCNRIEIPEEVTYTFFYKGVKVTYWGRDTLISK